MISEVSSFSIVIPFYNEATCLTPVVQEIVTVLDQNPDIPFELILVNDGSTDGTKELINKLSAGDSRIKALHLRANAGQSAALAAGFSHATGTLIGTLDGDGQNDPADFPSLIRELHLRNVDMMCGIRKDRHDSLLRKLSSRIANSVRSRVLGDNVTDIGCAIRVFRRDCLTSIPFYRNAHRFFPALFMMNGFSVSEMPVSHRERISGTSKYGFGINTRLWTGIVDLLGTLWLKKRVLNHTIIQGETKL